MSLARAVSHRGGRVFVEIDQHRPRRPYVSVGSVCVILMLVVGVLVTVLSPGIAAIGCLGVCGP